MLKIRRVESWGTNKRLRKTRGRTKWPIKGWDEIVTPYLYLCFSEQKMDGTIAHVIQTIALQDVLSASSEGQGLVPVHYCGDRPDYMGCGLMGSKIVFGGGFRTIFDSVACAFTEYPSSEVYVLETDPKDPHRSIKKQPGMVNSLLAAKPYPLLVEVHGNLYALASHPVSRAAVPITPSFEVWNARERKWTALPEPPSFSRYFPDSEDEDEDEDEDGEDPHNPDCFLFFRAVVGTNIFVASAFSPSFRFDMNEPYRGWKQCSGWSNEMAAEFSGRSFAVQDGEGDWVIFDYKYYRRTSIQVYLMSSNYETLVKMKQPLELPPGLPSGFIPSDFNFVSLGGPRVCLVLSIFLGPDTPRARARNPRECAFEMMRVVTIPFEFQVIDKGDSFTVRANFLAAPRILDYSTEQSEEQKATRADMLGVFFCKSTSCF